MSEYRHPRQTGMSAPPNARTGGSRYSEIDVVSSGKTDFGDDGGGFDHRGFCGAAAGASEDGSDDVGVRRLASLGLRQSAGRTRFAGRAVREGEPSFGGHRAADRGGGAG